MKVTRRKEIKCDLCLDDTSGFEVTGDGHTIARERTEIEVCEKCLRELGALTDVMLSEPHVTEIAI